MMKNTKMAIKQNKNFIDITEAHYENSGFYYVHNKYGIKGSEFLWLREQPISYIFVRIVVR